ILGCLPKPASKPALLAVLERMSVENPPKAKAVDLKLTAADLTRGIEAGELFLHYQPKVGVATGRLDSVESLVRWMHPKHGLIGPNTFVPLAEDSGAIGLMTERMVDLAFRQLAAWQDHGLRTHM